MKVPIATCVIGAEPTALKNKLKKYEEETKNMNEEEKIEYYKKQKQIIVDNLHKSNDLSKTKTLKK